MADAITVKPAKAAPAMTDTEIVRPAKPAPAQKIALSPIDQYMGTMGICFMLLFPLSTNSENMNVYSELKAGLSLTLSEFPFIGGYLAPEGAGAGERFQIKVDEGHSMRFVYRDFTTSDSQAKFKYSYDELKRNYFPCLAFDREVLAPVQVAVREPEPAVMAAQANFVHGGLILSIYLDHRATDAFTLGAVLNAWATHTNVTDLARSNGPGASIHSLTPRSMDRTPMSNGLVGAQLKDYPEFKVVNDPRATSQALVAHTEVTTAAAALAAASPLQLESSVSFHKICIVHITTTRLRDLKDAASPASPSDGWISTNDAVCAFLWRHIARVQARLAGNPQPDPHIPETPLNLALAVEARRRMIPALPKDYLGNAVFHCAVTSDLTTVTSPSTPLPTIARLVRGAITRFDSARMRGVIGLIDSIPKLSELTFRMYLDPMRGLIISSWTDTGLYESEWGAGLGKAEGVRFPDKLFPAGLPPCVIFLRRPDGGLEVLIGMEDAAIQLLREDEEFLSFVEWKGVDNETLK